MAPKRATRPRAADSVYSAESDKTHSTSTTESRELRGSAVVKTMTPGPAKYSTSYGSPLTVMPRKNQTNRHINDLSSAFNTVVEDILETNENDTRARARREAEEARAKNEEERRQQIEAKEEERRKHEEQARTRKQPRFPKEDIRDALIAKGAEAAARLLEDEPVDLIDIVGQQDGQGLTPGRAQPPNANPRSSSLEPASSARYQTRSGGRGPNLNTSSSGGRRQMSEPLSHLETGRSFFEESNLFGDATVFTPSRTGPRAKVGNLFGSTPSKVKPVEPTILEEEEAPQIPTLPPQPTNPEEEWDFRPPGPGTSVPSGAPPDRLLMGLGAPRYPRVPLHRDPQDLEQSKKGADNRRSEQRQNSPPRPDDEEDGWGTKVDTNVGRRKPGRPKRNLVEELQSGHGRMTRNKLSDHQVPVGSGSSGGRGRDARRPVPPGDAEALPPRVVLLPRGEGELAPAIDHPRALLDKASDIWQKMAIAVSFLVLSWIAIRVVVISTTAPEEYDGYRVDNRLRWHGSDWRSNIRQLVPYSLLHPLGAISDDEFNAMNHYWRSRAHEVQNLKRATKVHEDAIGNLKHILPAVVKMELDKNGKPVISQEFWHALRGLIAADKDIFTLGKGKAGSREITDEQWAAIRHRLEAGGQLSNTKALSVSEIEAIAEGTLDKSWENWVKSNSDSIRHLLGTGQSSTVASDGSVIDVEKLLKEKLNSREFKNILMTKDDFIKQLKGDFVAHRREIRAELSDLEATLLEKVKDAATVASSPSPPAGLAKHEVVAIVDQRVRKAIADAHLEAMAKSKISHNWLTELSQQVNFFQVSTGAIVNQPFTSPTFRPPKPKFWTEEWQRNMPGSHATAYAALSRWEEEGECWCAATRRGNNETMPADLAVKMGHSVIPQQLVVEHVHASATLDPGAMPRDFEVWAQIPDHGQRTALHDWSATQFPDTDTHDPLFGHGFVKIGQFVYENTGSERGVMVYRVPPVVENLKASTDHVIVRALRNHGDQDHTCFYRVMMYGEIIDEEVTAEA